MASVPRSAAAEISQRALLIYLAELALQFSDLLFDAPYKLLVGNRVRQLPVPLELHFEFHAFVFDRTAGRPSF